MTTEGKIIAAIVSAGRAARRERERMETEHGPDNTTTLRIPRKSRMLIGRADILESLRRKQQVQRALGIRTGSSVNDLL